MVRITPPYKTNLKTTGYCVMIKRIAKQQGNTATNEVFFRRQYLTTS